MPTDDQCGSGLSERDVVTALLKPPLPFATLDIHTPEPLPVRK